MCVCLLGTLQRPTPHNCGVDRAPNMVNGFSIPLHARNTQRLLPIPSPRLGPRVLRLLARRNGDVPPGALSLFICRGPRAPQQQLGALIGGRLGDPITVHQVRPSTHMDDNGVRSQAIRIVNGSLFLLPSSLARQVMVGLLRFLDSMNLFEPARPREQDEGKHGPRTNGLGHHILQKGILRFGLPMFVLTTVSRWYFMYDSHLPNRGGLHREAVLLSVGAAIWFGVGCLTELLFWAARKHREL